MSSSDSIDDSNEDENPSIITQIRALTENEVNEMKKKHSIASKLASKIAKGIKQSRFNRKLLTECNDFIETDQKVRVLVWEIIC
jgi:hypothetical protein